MKKNENGAKMITSCSMSRPLGTASGVTAQQAAAPLAKLLSKACCSVTSSRNRKKPAAADATLLGTVHSSWPTPCMRGRSCVCGARNCSASPVGDLWKCYRSSHRKASRTCSTRSACCASVTKLCWQQVASRSRAASTSLQSRASRTWFTRWAC